MKTQKKFYLVTECSDPPKIIGLYRTKAAAREAAYNDPTKEAWRNIVPMEVKD